MSDDDTPPIGQHYPDHRERAEVRPGLREPVNVTHVPIEAAQGIERELEACRELWEACRHPRTDATWPGHQQRLRHMFRELIAALRHDLADDRVPKWHEWLRDIRFFLGAER